MAILSEKNFFGKSCKLLKGMANIMKKKNSKKNLPIANNLSKDEMIEIQAEAYYRAFKRIKKEEGEEIESNVETNIEKRKYKWYENVLYFFNVFFFPWVISKHVLLNKQLYDLVLVFFVSAIMLIIGTIAWIMGVTGFIYSLYLGIALHEIRNMLSLLGICLLMVALGSIIIISGNSFGNETNSERIYAYSACILALMSCAIGIVSLLR